jgi:hypothetical protein
MAIGVLNLLQAFISSPFDKGDRGFNKKANQNIIIAITITSWGKEGGKWITESASLSQNIF